MIVRLTLENTEENIYVWDTKRLYSLRENDAIKWCGQGKQLENLLTGQKNSEK